MKKDIETQVRSHFEDLVKLFPEIKECDPLTFCRKLRQIEKRAHKLAEANCNGEIDEAADVYNSCQIENEMNELFAFSHEFERAFRLNGDPRGYALKLDDSFVRSTGSNIHRDWGGYGILAPEFK